VKFLAELANYVSDAYLLAPSTEFVPEDIVLGQYTFLPWVRGGIGAVVQAPAAGSLRASVSVSVPVQADGVPDVFGGVTVEVRGPGDVTGLIQADIIRQYPLPGALGVEDSFLAHIEFDSPAMPWAFSPEPAAGERLTPWVALVVLAQGRYTYRPGTGGEHPDQVQTFLGELHPSDSPWAWAHAQLIGPAATGPSIDDRLTTAYAAVNLSRLLCPRRLRPDTQYRACVVPYYNAGAAKGMGAPPPASLAPAWTRAPGDDDVAITLPVYASWTFSTGDAGDFASLAEKLHGVPAPWQIGRRLTEMDQPGGQLPDLVPGDTGALQTIHGPLVSPIAPNPGSADPIEQAAVVAESARWPAAETEALRTLLNRPDALAKATTPAGPIPRPIVGPEIYDRYQAAASRLDSSRDADWFGQLNLAPEHRAQAGLGTRVVQMDQEQLMQSAWAQVGEIDAVNRALRQTQLARFVATATYERHITPLAFGDLLAATRRVQSRVLATPALTVAADVGDSNLADAATSSAFRRVTRPLGGLARYVAADPTAHAQLVAIGDSARDMQRTYVELDGAPGVTDVLLKAIDAPVNTADYGVWAGKLLLEHLAHGVSIGAARDPAWQHAAAGLAQSVGYGVPELRQDAARLVERLKVDAQPQQSLVGLLIRTREVNPDAIAEGFKGIGVDLVSNDWPGTPVRPGLASTPAKLVELIEPRVNLTARTVALLGPKRPAWLPVDWFDDLLLTPVMAAPVFTRPMYQALDAYSREWLLPGLAKFQQPDLVTVLVSNAAFIEAFLAGLSNEMGRELLWRGYPTDQRGTYFRRFWNPAADDLAQDLARFAPTPLGKHVVPGIDGKVVLMVRGELIRRYPNATVLAMYAGDQDANGVPIFEAGPSAQQPVVLAPIQFHGHLDPDTTLVGFDLTVDELRAGVHPTGPGRSAGWWFVIAEHPTAPRFGLAEQSTFSGGELVPSRSELGWDTMLPAGNAFLAPTARLVEDGDGTGKSATFGADAAQTAHVLLRYPFRAAFEAIALITPAGAL
jgi:hypothetical protein